MLVMQLFQSTLPARGATDEYIKALDEVTISIHAPREGSDGARARLPLPVKAISIHAPREGSDGLRSHVCFALVRISIHAPREGSDLIQLQARSFRFRFQSTLPARGATSPSPATAPTPPFQSTLPARGATTGGGMPAESGHDFNPRSPRGERLFMSKA